jgi:hypothetical protein
MYRLALWRLAYRVGLLMLSILPLAMACGEPPPEEPKPRPLPEDTQTLSPGTYRSEEFEPSFSFTIGEGWTNQPVETSDNLALTWGQTWLLRFFKAQEVYNPNERYGVVDAPKDLIGWLRRHPYVRASTPEPVTVGGVEGERMDVTVVGDLPEDHVGACGPDCLDLFLLSDGSALGLVKGDKARGTVLEDVEGETLIIGFVGPADEFDLQAAETQKVIDSVEWRDE